MFHQRNIAMAIEKRVQNLTPATYDEENRTVDAVLSRGSPVARFYGTEKLEISRKAIDLSRMTNSGISVLDSHQQIGIANSLGKLTRVWIENDSAGAALMGTIRFHETKEGRKAEAMVARGEIGGVSVGYHVEAEDWRITDSDGDEVDPNSTRWGEDDLIFTATRWAVMEVSIVSVPADADAGVRAAAALRDDRAFQLFSREHRDIVARVRARHAMAMRGGGTLYIAAPDIPGVSIFDAPQHQASSVQEIRERMQKLHDLTFGYPTYADCYFKS